MDKKSLYDLNIIEKMGTPLINAVIRGSFSEGGGINESDVSKIADLLNSTVKLAQNLSGSFKPENEQDVDAIRTAVACLISPILGEHYTRTGNDFSDDDLAKYQQIFEKILSFSDNLAEAKEAANKRISLVNPDALGISNAVLYDDEQIALQTIEAFLPVVEEISSYSFGLEPRALLSEIIDKIKSQSKIATKALFGKLTDDGAKQLAELGIIRSLAEIYAASHAAEKKRIEALGEEEQEALINDQGEVSLNTLWDGFNQRYSLIITLAKSLKSGETTAASTAGTAGSDAVKPAAKEEEQAPQKDSAKDTPSAEAEKVETPETKEVVEKKEAKPSEEKNPEEKSAQPSQPAAPENPMSFFAKKKSG